MNVCKTQGVFKLFLILLSAVFISSQAMAMPKARPLPSPPPPKPAPQPAQKPVSTSKPSTSTSSTATSSPTTGNVSASLGRNATNYTASHGAGSFATATPATIRATPNVHFPNTSINHFNQFKTTLPTTQRYIHHHGARIPVSQTEHMRQLRQQGARRLSNQEVRDRYPNFKRNERRRIFIKDNGTQEGLEIRLMGGVMGTKNPLKGPRTVYSRPGTNERMYPDGRLIRGNKTKSERQEIGHVHGQSTL